jgi:hypothetical protein
VGADTAGTAEVAQIENDGWGPAVSLGFNSKKRMGFLGLHRIQTQNQLDPCKGTY